MVLLLPRFDMSHPPRWMHPSPALCVFRDCAASQPNSHTSSAATFLASTSSTLLYTTHHVSILHHSSTRTLSSCVHDFPDPILTFFWLFRIGEYGNFQIVEPSREEQYSNYTSFDLRLDMNKTEYQIRFFHVLVLEKVSNLPWYS